MIAITWQRVAAFWCGISVGLAIFYIVQPEILELFSVAVCTVAWVLMLALGGSYAMGLRR